MLPLSDLPSAVASLSVALVRSNESLRDSNSLAHRLHGECEELTGAL